MKIQLNIQETSDLEADTQSIEMALVWEHNVPPYVPLTCIQKVIVI